MKTTSIFITYNPNSDLEETLAARLHTIGVVNGFNMFMPDRFESVQQISNETKARISRSDYFIMFSTKPLSNVVKEEIGFAFNYLNDRSKIIVIYDKEKGRNLQGEIADYFTAFYLDKYENGQVELLNEIINIIAHKEKNQIIDTQKSEIKKLKSQKEESNALAAILGIGLGLLVLGAVLDRK